MSENVALTPEQFERGLVFNFGDHEGLKIECNFCSGAGHVFSDTGDDNAAEGWVKNAAEHMVEFHIARLKEVS